MTDLAPQPRLPVQALRSAREMVVDRRASLTTWDLLGPTIIVDGKAVGTWKREGNKSQVTLNMANSLKQSEKLAIKAAAERYAAFVR